MSSRTTPDTCDRRMEIAMPEVLLTKSDAGEVHLTGTSADVDVARPVVEFVSAVNRGDLDAAIAQLAPDALHHGRVANYRPEGVRVLFTMLREVLPDLRLDIRELKVEGNRVITRIVASGTHTGSYLGKPPTGRPVVWESTDIAELGYHKEAEIDHWKVLKRFWDVWNDPQLWKELGVIPGIMC
jgi:predicted ester cyclase